VGFEYSLGVFGSLIADSARTDAYRTALRNAITPDSVVLDIGTGTGVFACLACQLGARKVYAVEPSDVVHIARAVASRNGFANRIQFIQDRSTSIDLPEKADVVISDLRGVLPLFEHHLTSIIDARARLMKAGGVVIPQADTIIAALVENERFFRRQAGPWLDDPYGVDMRIVKQFTLNTWTNRQVEAEHLLAPPCPWTELDYRTLDAPDVSGDVCWTVSRSGTAHGLCAWFDATIGPGASYTSGPGPSRASVYGNAYFPFLEPVSVDPGDRVSMKLQARLVGGDYVWRWSTTFVRRDRAPVSFEQSTFVGRSWSPTRLLKRTPTYVPRASEDAQIDSLILRLIDGRMRAEQIAQRVASEFPHRFSSLDDAQSRVADLMERYG